MQVPGSFNQRIKVGRWCRVPSIPHGGSDANCEPNISRSQNSRGGIINRTRRQKSSVDAFMSHAGGNSPGSWPDVEFLLSEESQQVRSLNGRLFLETKSPPTGTRCVLD